MLAFRALKLPFQLQLPLQMPLPLAAWEPMMRSPSSRPPGPTLELLLSSSRMRLEAACGDLFASLEREAPWGGSAAMAMGGIGVDIGVAVEPTGIAALTMSAHATSGCSMNTDAVAMQSGVAVALLEPHELPPRNGMLLLF